jgi:hypothetical protein
MKRKTHQFVRAVMAGVGVITGAVLSLVATTHVRAAECVSITCPKDIVTGCEDKNGAEVSFAPDASTSCGTTITVACLPPSGSTFPIGTNLVTCAVSDPRGNMDRCIFFVIVTNTPPEIKCPDDIVTECHSPIGSLVNFTPTASAGCDAPVTIVCHPPSGSVFPIGTNSVGCEAKDGFGRTDRCSFLVIVTNGPPSITCPPPQTLTAGTNCKAIMPLLPFTVIERCTPSNQLFFAQNPPAGAVLTPGVHPVTITVSEGLHLSASCSTTVTVEDKTPPKISCPGSIWKYCAPDGTNAFFDVTAKDSCGGPVTVTCEPPSGSFFPAGGTWVKCTATDTAGNSSECSFMVNVTGASQFMSFVGGKKDHYALPADPPTHGACLLTAAAGLSLGSSFDVSFSGRWLGHTFENLPGGIQWAKLRFRMRPKSNLASNDTVRVGAACGGGFSTWLWSAPIASLPEAGGQWTVNSDTQFTLDLSAMPGAPAALLPLLNLEVTHRVDVLVGDDTVVDFVQLDVGVCGVSGAAGGVPYMVKTGNAARGADGGIRLYSDERVPFDVDFNVGKAEGIEIELGDWPGATNPPIDECTTPVGSYVGTKLNWAPYGTELCTVEFNLNPAQAYTDLTLSQPTNIFGGRAIEVWRDGQLVSRHFVEGGTGPGGVILYNQACVQSMGFGMGDFFIALSEMSSVSFVNAKHISGETEPMMGDFIRLIFNIPFTVGGNGPRVDFDPDWVLNVKGREMSARGLNVRKFGGLIDVLGEGLMSVGNNVVVAPGGTEEWTVSTCYTPPQMGDDENNTHLITLTLADLFAGKEIKPGAAFDLVATAEYGTTPPIDAVIGRMRCEILSVNPLTTRFRVNYSDLGLETDLTLYQLYNTTPVPSHQQLDVMGAPAAVKMFVYDNYPIFYLDFDAPWGDVLADGQSVKEVETAWFAPRTPPPGVHRKPYRFCVTTLQAWEQKPITFTSPVTPTPPPPAPHAPCITLRCPTNIVTWSRGEGVKVPFEVEARSACGSNVTVVCVPPSGSEFLPGVTWVQCHAADELGNSARCRFPVVVYDREPRLSIQPAGDGWAILRWPVEFDDWQLERTRDLRSPRWERFGRGSETDGVTRLRRLMVGDPTVGDPSVGDPTGFFRLRAP